ncbi:MAG: 3-phosphoshikimate 1-carboxyvinyltransferase [Gammaproteobacteria bacterium]|nr:MAG: 3-phosphoshikimate 1-carboxyvinyltransferase [Gammaproteobacteria bacterium]
MSAHWTSEPAGPISGRLRVPGDKSISHRALLLGAIARGRTEIDGFLPGQDCLATLAAVRALGVRVEQPSGDRVLVDGVGLQGLQPPAGPLDMGNSGTAIRLLAGLLAGQRFDSVLTGDESLRRRPMERLAEPLRLMGAVIDTRAGCAPLTIHGGRRLHGIDYRLPVASAQVKSAILLAGLYASGETRVREPAVTRDHTERMLLQFGAPLARSDRSAGIRGGGELSAAEVQVPGDFSSAAFFLLAATVTPGSDLLIERVGLNPTRTGLLEILRRMGADIETETLPAPPGGEPVGNLRVRHARLRGIDVPAALVPLAIDEFPVVFVAAALADGVTTIRGAEELRHKESDRIAVVLRGLRALGVAAEERPDGAVIRGGRLAAGRVDSAGDHRVAMAFAAASAVAGGPLEIADTANVATSFPNFLDLASAAGLRLAAAASAVDD